MQVRSLGRHSWVGHLLDMWFSSMSLSVKLVFLSAQAGITEYAVRRRLKDGMLQLAHSEDLTQQTQRKQTSPKGTWSPSSPSPCCFSVTRSCLTLCAPRTEAHQAPLSSTISQSLLKFMSIESKMLSNHLIFCCAFLLSSFFLQSFPTSGHFPMNQFFPSCDQSIEASVSASASVLLMNFKDWFPLGLTGFISSLSKGLSRVFSV